MRIVALVAVGLYLAACALLYFTQERLLFPGAFMPLPAEYAGDGGHGGLQTAEIVAPDGARLFALQHAPEDGQPLIILFHGNASYPESYDFLYGSWIAYGYGIVAPAARGYPRSSGPADGEMMLADALAMHDWAVKSYPGHKIYVVGQSLGSAPAVHVAARREVAGLLLISPFESMLSLVREKMPFFPIAWLLKSPFRSDLDMPLVKAPTLIVHGDSDDLVPIQSARRLAALARTEVQFDAVGGAGHAARLFNATTIDRINIFLGLYTP